MKTLKKTLLVVVVIFFLIFFGTYIWGLIGVHIPYGEGERIGTIVKFSNKGLIWKTWEADMVVRSSGISYGDFWGFSIDNNAQNKAELVEKIQKALENEQLVRIKYEQKAGTVPWRGKTTYYIKEVIVAE